MKKILLFIIPFIFLSCSIKTFELIDAKSKRYAGGTRLSGSGVVYSFILKAENSSNKIHIDTIFISTRCFTDFSIHKINAIPGDNEYSKGDTILVSVNYNKRPEIKEGPGHEITDKYIESGFPCKIPKEFDAIAVIKVCSGKKHQYIAIDKFKVMTPELRP